MSNVLNYNDLSSSALIRSSFIPDNLPTYQPLKSFAYEKWCTLNADAPIWESEPHWRGPRIHTYLVEGANKSHSRTYTIKPPTHNHRDYIVYR